MEKPYFVMLFTQNGDRLVPMADPENVLYMFDTHQEADAAARQTFYGMHCGFQIHCANTPYARNWEKLAKERGEGEAQQRAENIRLREALDRIVRFPVHSEPVGGAMAMQDIAYEALNFKVCHNCTYWEPITLGGAPCHVSIAEMGVCSIFDKRTSREHGKQCTAWAASTCQSPTAPGHP